MKTDENLPAKWRNSRKHVHAWTCTCSQTRTSTVLALARSFCSVLMNLHYHEIYKNTKNNLQKLYRYFLQARSIIRAFVSSFYILLFFLVKSIIFAYCLCYHFFILFAFCSHAFARNNFGKTFERTSTNLGIRYWTKFHALDHNKNLGSFQPPGLLLRAPTITFWSFV